MSRAILAIVCALLGGMLVNCCWRELIGMGVICGVALIVIIGYELEQEIPG